MKVEFETKYEMFDDVYTLPKDGVSFIGPIYQISIIKVGNVQKWFYLLVKRQEINGQQVTSIPNYTEDKSKWHTLDRLYLSEEEIGGLSSEITPQRAPEKPQEAPAEVLEKKDTTDPVEEKKVTEKPKKKRGRPKKSKE